MCVAEGFLALSDGVDVGVGEGAGAAFLFVDGAFYARLGAFFSGIGVDDEVGVALAGDDLLVFLGAGFGGGGAQHGEDFGGACGFVAEGGDFEGGFAATGHFDEH